MTHLLKIALPMTFAAILVGCTGTAPPSENAKIPEAPTTGGDGHDHAKHLRVGIVFDSGGRGDKSFNDSAWAGIERAKKDFHIEETSIQSPSPAVYEGNLTKLADQNMDIVFAVGLGQGSALDKVAAKFPKAIFAIVDGDVKAPNVRMLKFKEEQGSFLAGYLAGCVTKTNKIGFVGGMEIPLIKKFQYGYAAGAKMANPKVELLPVKYTNDWNNADAGKASASVLYASGADIVYHAAGRAGLGVFTAAKEANKFAIGVDSNQDDIQKGLILTSMVKRVDEAVYQTIKDVVEGKFQPGEKVYDVASGGIGLTNFEFTKDKIGEQNLKLLKEVEEMIAKGELVVPSNEKEYNEFIEKLKVAG
ncbi:MAG: BMP family ABC transporter substrate-binding protein [Fimbriimonadaceae bacterium]|nr:BMP family ABC transporter substrate-binding protein [Fimbriimonadaceae bacterium]